MTIFYLVEVIHINVLVPETSDKFTLQTDNIFICIFSTGLCTKLLVKCITFYCRERRFLQETAHTSFQSGVAKLKFKFRQLERDHLLAEIITGNFCQICELLSNCFVKIRNYNFSVPSCISL